MSTQKKNTDQNNGSGETAVEKRKPTITERFTNEVKRQFQGAVGRTMDLDEHQKQLMTNMFIRIDSVLEEAEARREQQNKGGLEYTWENVDMQKLALDAMHRIRLGLDALIDNHLHPIPYKNNKTGKYDMNLMIGYKGKLYYRKQVALYPIKDVRLELVHENDDFTVIKKSGREAIEDYEFKINDPFDRGSVVGGFGYIVYEDEAKNELVIVTQEDFKKARNAAKSSKFWGPYETEMKFKTLSHRTAEAIDIDPRKVNQSFHYVEAQDNPYKEDMEVTQPQDREQLNFGENGADSEEPSGVTDAQDAEVIEEPEGEEQHEGLTSKEKEKIFTDITARAKAKWGDGWLKKIKEVHREIDPTASNMTELSDEALQETQSKIHELTNAD